MKHKSSSSLFSLSLVLERCEKDVESCQQIKESLLKLDQITNDLLLDLTQLLQSNGFMKVHLQPLFIQAKVDEIGVNKVLVDGGAVVSLMHESLLKKIGKCGTYLKPHNIFMSNYDGKAGFLLGVVQENLTVFMLTMSQEKPCSFAKNGCNYQIDVSSLRLDPTHGFISEEGVLNSEITAKDIIPPSRRIGSNDDHV
ncbi:hypothetical protein MTR_4g051542 [Medicago truncatula]|uniref:Uncharacterized protein n=1 Tax=Medicago truncatula TaxID=3880 RepID=A0A072UV67_MEDTR|nr:hypothetical protein MTR_4g051542 [Medicago truncatula]